MDITQLNIENLVSLWQRVGKHIGGYTPGLAFDCCLKQDSDWPNRLWFHQDITEKSLQAAKKRLQSLPIPLVVPYWDIYQNPSASSLLEVNGFKRVSEQVGMYLPFDGTHEPSPDVVLAEVADEASARRWAELFRSAFGYTISATLLWPNHPAIRCMIAYYNHHPVGTAMLHVFPDTVLGIHAVGIIPAMHRKGLGEKLMRTLLFQAKGQGFGYVTLQASQPGRGLYLKLGFKEQFVMKNYALQKQS